ncbi:MAG: type IV pilus assembly protein PilM [Candidatus Sumerlaeota bacterium]
MAGLKRCLGIDFEGQSVKLIELANEKGHVRVVRALSQPLPVGADAMESERANAIVGVVRDMIKSNKISTKKAFFCMPGQTVFVHRQRLPRAALSKLTQAIRMEARRAIPFPLEKTILRYQIFEEEHSNEVEVLLVAMKRETNDDFMRMVKRMGLRVSGVSVSSLALYNAQELRTLDMEKWLKGAAGGGLLGMGGKKKKKGEAEEESEEDEFADLGGGFEEIRAYVHLGARSTDLAICKGGEVDIVGFTRSIPTGGNSFTKAIMNEYKLESFSEAQEIKNSKTAVMSGQFEIEADQEAYDEKACEIVTRLADRLIAEIRRSLDYYISQPDGMAVDIVNLSGEGVHMPYLAGYVEERLGVPVEVTNELPNTRIEVADAVDEDFEAADYMIAIGLAAQGLGMTTLNIDFMSGPSAAKAGGSGGGAMPAGLSMEIAAMVAIIAGMVYLGTQVGNERKISIEEQVVQLDSNISRLQGREKQYNDATAVFNRSRSRIDTLQKGYITGDFWLRFLADLQRFKPAEILVTNISCWPNATDPSISVVTLRGEAELQASVTNFVNNLKSEDAGNYIHNVTLSSLRQVSSRYFGTRANAFELSIQVADTEGRVISLLTDESLTAPAETGSEGEERR